MSAGHALNQTQIGLVAAMIMTISNHEEFKGKSRGSRSFSIGFGLIQLMISGICLLCGNAWAQSSVTGKVLNGTTSRPVINQKVELLTLGQKMNVTKEDFTRDDGRFTFEEVELAAASPHILLRTIYQGVNYNLSLSSPEEMTSPQLLTIYETATELENIEVSMPAMLVLANGNDLRVEQQYLVKNGSNPMRTLVNSQRTFQFDTPLLGKTEDLTISVLGLGRIPLPQRPLKQNKGGYRINYPMKPGVNEIMISYRVKFKSNDRELKLRLLDGTEHSQLFVKPSNLQVSGKGVEERGVDSRTESAMYHLGKISKGEFLNLRITGDAPEHSADDGHDHGGDSEFQVVRLPNRIFQQKIIILGIFGALSLAIIFFALGQQSRERTLQQVRKRKKKG